jgi:predicted ATPase
MHLTSDVPEWLGEIRENRHTLPLLIKDLRNGIGLIPFVGAGMSVQSGFPDWTKFLRLLAEESEAQEKTEELLAANAYEETAEYLLRRLEHRAFQDLFEGSFGKNFVDKKQLKGAVTIVPRLAGGPVITTNFDRVLESVFEAQRCPLEVARGSNVEHFVKAFQQNQAFLLKLHGDWDIQDGRVLTKAEYEKAYGDPIEIDFKLPLPKLLWLMLSSRQVLFLGCSLTNDRTVSILRRVALEFRSSAHYAIVEKPANKTTYRQRSRFLSKLGIRPIFYPTGKHSLLEPLLSFLAKNASKGKAAAMGQLEPPNNIPASLNRFIGREAALKRLRVMLKANRLVTIAGVGGCGKTRLAMELARIVRRQYPDGVWIVKLYSLREPGLVPQRVAFTLGIREQATCPPTKALAEYLRERKVLLVLDNCDHLVSECTKLATHLLEHCPKLTMLAVSRHLFDVTTETVFSLDPLNIPNLVSLPVSSPEFDELCQNESVRLFVDRARSRRGDFAVTPANAPAMGLLCRGLDGIPLAIELAASLVNAMSVEEITDSLRVRFQVLARTQDAVERQWQTLKAAIDWSYELLQPAERTLLRRLSIFGGGWTCVAARICVPDNDGENVIINGLRKLRNNSLIVAEPRSEQTRYRLLVTIREYGLEKLRLEGEEPELARRYAEWCVELSERTAPELLGGEQEKSLDVLAAEADNLRGAMRWAIDKPDAEIALRLCGALWRFMEIRGHFREGRERIEEVLKIPQSSHFPALRSKALSGGGMLAYRQTDLPTAGTMFSESLAIERELGNKPGIANALNDLGNVAQLQGDFQRARELYRESLDLELENKNERGIAVAQFNTGNTARRLGEYEEAIPLLEQSRDSFEKARNKRESAFARNSLAQIALAKKDLDRGRREAEESLRIRRKLEDKRGAADTLRTLAGIMLAEGDHEGCRQLLTESLTLTRGVKDHRGIAECLESFASLAATMGQPARCALLYGAAEALRLTLDLPLAPIEAAEKDRYSEQVRKQLGDRLFTKGRASGHGLNLEQAADRAVQEAEEVFEQSVQTTA